MLAPHAQEKLLRQDNVDLVVNMNCTFDLTKRTLFGSLLSAPAHLIVTPKRQHGMTLRFELCSMQLACRMGEHRVQIQQRAAMLQAEEAKRRFQVKVHNIP